MSFRENLQHLRTTRNMTQEQLAMLVGVSRQSVTKWESERAYPEMDKLLKLCQIFDCSLDDLVRGDLTARAAESELVLPADAPASDVVGYDEHQRTFASRVALGVVAIILGVACAAPLEGLLGEGAATVPVFVGVGMGLALIIPAGIGHTAFQKAHPYVVDFYTAEQRMAGKRLLSTCLVAGIGLILAACAFGGLGGHMVSENTLGGIFLGLVAAGVGLIVYGSLMDGRLNVEAYNIGALEELNEDEIAGIVGEERAPVMLEKVKRSRATGRICGIIMLVATAIALPLMFWGTSAHHSFWASFFWIPWMLGGICCGIASLVLGNH